MVRDAVIAQREKRGGFDEERGEESGGEVEPLKRRGEAEGGENEGARRCLRESDGAENWLFFFARGGGLARRAASRMHCSGTHAAGLSA